MCEDRALRMRKESKAKRIQQLRARIRASRLAEIHSESSNQSQPDGSPQQLDQASSPFPPHLNIPEAKAFAAVIECVAPGVYRYKPDAALHLSPEVRARNERLIEIALKTVILIRRNQQLQQKLAALQNETSSFITNVMTNPENRQSQNDEDDINGNSVLKRG